MAQTLLEEIKLIRESNKSAMVDIKDLAEKYIPIGSHESKVIEYLKSQGFIAYQVDQKFLKNKLSVDKAINFLYKYEKVGIASIANFADEIEISICIKNGMTTSVSGRIINRAL